MTIHFLRDLEKLKKEILTLGSMVEEATRKAIISLIERRPELAEEVIAGDSVIDAKELDVEDIVLKILALHQPVAIDLRFIIVVMKVNNDLERIGDLAANIAERSAYLIQHEPIDVQADLRKMTSAVLEMLRNSLDALVNSDAKLARKVIDQDNEVDEIHRKMWRGLQDLMCSDPAFAKRAATTQSAIYHLERIADHTTNIAEDVIFLTSGEVVRHEQLRKQRTR